VAEVKSIIMTNMYEHIPDHFPSHRSKYSDSKVQQKAELGLTDPYTGSLFERPSSDTPELVFHHASWNKGATT
jgi:hypothetical protein